ncbi:MAG TPA: FKBP-type peptidyl-prolyl cis-trans isomerase [Terracidiphilus sp.]
MKQIAPIFVLSVCAACAFAQTAAKPAVAHHPAAKSATAAKSGLPAGIPRVPGVVKTEFSLRYQDIKIGTGAEAEPNKLYHVLYTGWLAADGHKFDTTDDHRKPELDKDGKPVLGDDGKPKLGAPEPIVFPQGFGRVIAGFDQGFNGMKVGGKRRIFIPWQLAYGAKGRPGPDAKNPGIPPKADLIFDVELVEVSDMQMPSGHPGMTPGGMHPGGAMPAGHPQVTMPGAAKPAEGAQPATAPKPDAAAQPHN